MNPSRRPPHPRRLFVALAVALLLVPAGLVAGAGFKVTKAPGEKGFGTFLQASGAGGWWTFLTFTTGTVPTGLTAVNTSSTGPSLLAGNASSSFGLGPTTTGAAAYIWVFQMGATAPSSTELKLNFTLVLFGTATHIVGYLKTPATAPTAAQLVRIYFPIPTSPPSGLPYLSFLEASSVCTSVGVCP